MKIEQKDTCREILMRYGKDNQIDMCIEECAELIDALCKFKRNRIGFKNVCSEIADVMIMATQMAMVFGEQKVTEIIAMKLDRQKKRMEGGMK